ncbi:MAG: response regulator [Planctomycetaceae bacterium]|nr:response regulator [Planctomycetales bacterium]MCB9926033.1 response regulator [Planctomycetaceae bacterium]
MFNDRRLSVLVVDDDSDVVDFMAHVLRSENCEVCLAADGEQALEQADNNELDVVFLDINIPEQDGWLVCSKLKMKLEGPRIVLMTGRTEDDTDRFAHFVHADDVLKKPFSDTEVLRILRRSETLSG